jgi:hypothetical protein
MAKWQNWHIPVPLSPLYRLITSDLTDRYHVNLLLIRTLVVLLRTFFVLVRTSTCLVGRLETLRQLLSCCVCDHSNMCITGMAGTFLPHRSSVKMAVCNSSLSISQYLHLSLIQFYTGSTICVSSYLNIQCTYWLLQGTDTL